MLPHNTALERREHFCGGWLVLSSKVHTHHITFTQSQACPTQDDKQGDRWTDSWKITHIPRVARAATLPKQIVSLLLRPRARAYRVGQWSGPDDCVQTDIAYSPGCVTKTESDRVPF